MSTCSVRPKILTVLDNVEKALKADAKPVSIDGGTTRVDLNETQRIRIVLPGSRGLSLRHDNEEFNVANVQFHPSVGGLAYRGRYLSTTEENVAEFVPISDLVEIPGVSRTGFYDYDLAKIVEDSAVTEQLARTAHP